LVFFYPFLGRKERIMKLTAIAREDLETKGYARGMACAIEIVK
jgi:hypothetical protein